MSEPLPTWQRCGCRPPGPGAAMSDSPPHGAPRVLVIEDNPDARASLRLLLKLFGCEVEVAGDGIAGLRKALEWRPDAAVVDIGLPLIDGYQVARSVRAALGERVRLVAVTGYASPWDRDLAFLAGFDAHLPKPANPEALLRALGEPAGAH
jgi:two-component system, sensor histidine kinase